MADDKYLVLARKWRPETFDAVVGQDHITRTLKNAIATGRVGHAFLFIGSRGIGKTTTARILAKALNCLSSDKPTPEPCCTCENCSTIAAGNNLDVIEIDGASNNSVDDVRQIRENIRLVPSRSRYKVYVIDEVHQLSASAFNALLKTLEEPPEHAVFVLATTEAHKVPATIISRCQRYDFRRVGRDTITQLLQKILAKEGVKCSDEALMAIARAADGGVRDAESILEQLISYCGAEITFQDVFDVLGLVDWQMLHSLCEAILAKDIGKQLAIVENIVVEGKDLSQFVQDVLSYFRNLLVCKTADPKELIALPEEDIAAMQQHASGFTLTQLIGLVEQFAELSKDYDSQLAQRIALEALLIRISRVSVEVSVDSVLEKLITLGGGPGAGGAGHGSTGGGGSAAAEPKGPTAAPRQATEPSPDAAQRSMLTMDNLGELWPQVAQHAGEKSLNAGISLGHAEPVAVDGDTLVLRFKPHHARSKRVVERPENRTEIEAALAALTDNIRTFRSESAASSEKAPAAERERVKPAEAEAATADPHIAKVLDVFKGRIVSVRHNVNPAT